MQGFLVTSASSEPQRHGHWQTMTYALDGRETGWENSSFLYLLGIFQCFGVMAMLYASISQNSFNSLLNCTIAKTLDENESKNYFPRPHKIQS